MIDLGMACKQAEALLTAAEASPIRQFRYELRRRGREWEQAAKTLELALPGNETQPVIELAGSVCPGMRVLIEGRDEDDWAPVIRQLTQQGQFTIHVQAADGRDRYLNFAGPSSPVVVRS